MKHLLLFAFLFFLSGNIPSAFALKETSLPAQQLKRIAYSAKEGVEVFADTVGGAWCEDVPGLKLFANEETVFDPAPFKRLMAKIGAVLQKECPRAKQVILDGYSNNTLIYQGTASKENNWLPEKGLLNAKVQQLQQYSLQAVSSGTKTPFSVQKWAPRTGKHLAKVDEKTAFEYPIYSKNKKCAILYTTDKPPERIKKWFIEVNDNSCSEKLIYGKAEVLLYNEKGDLESTVKGYFTEGRFTGTKNWNALLLNRYGYNKNFQNISYLIDTDFDLKIYYLGYLSSIRNPKTGRYSSWKGCSPFTISAVTENEDLFLQPAVTNNILRAAQSFADVFCPEASQMKFFATTVPRGIPGMDEPEKNKKNDESNENLIYAVSLKKDKKHKWHLISDETQNLARLRDMNRRKEEEREHQLMMVDYNDLTKADYLGRLAYMHGVDDISNPIEAVLTSKIEQKPLSVSLLVHIANLGKKKAWADWPVDLRIDDATGLLKRTGWHIVSGDIMAEPARKSPDSFSAFLDLTAASVCDEDVCGEVSDLITLVRRRHDKPNWTPYKRKADNP